MAMTSIDLPLGTALPQFTLPLGGRAGTWSTSQAAGKPLLVLFICNHCPYVIHIAQQLAKLADAWQRDGLAVVAINSNDPAGKSGRCSAPSL